MTIIYHRHTQHCWASHEDQLLKNAYEQRLLRSTSLMHVEKTMQQEHKEDDGPCQYSNSTRECVYTVLEFPETEWLGCFHSILKCPVVNILYIIVYSTFRSAGIHKNCMHKAYYAYRFHW